MKSVFFTFLVVLSNLILAGPSKIVYSRIAGAYWDMGTHWSLTSGGSSCGCTPDESKDVIYVETNTSSSAGLTFASSATLIVRNNSTLTINGNTQFNNGCSINIEFGSSLIIMGDLTNENNSNQVVINGVLVVNGNYIGGTGSTITGTGSMSTTGSATTTGSASVFGSNGDCPIGPCYGSNENPLPIELLNFYAIDECYQVKLNWSTASEINNNFFSIEKSRDGMNWENIGKINGAGNSSAVHEYSFLDTNPYNGISYYRLKQTDFDGKYEYFNIIAIENCKSDNTAELVIYNNPSNGIFNLSFNGDKNMVSSINIFNTFGKEVYYYACYQETINILGVSAGVYVMHFNLKTKTILKKIVVR